MIRSLHVEKLGIVDRIDIDFGEGLSVLTGETGSGKSMLLQAIGLLSGFRASPSLVQKGEDEAEVSALIDFSSSAEAVSFLKSFGCDTPSEVMIRRTIRSSGRAKCYINAKPCSVTMLSELMAYETQITTQHQQQRLMDTDFQLSLVDHLAVNSADLAKMRDYYNRLKDFQRQLAQRQMSEQERVSKIDYLSFQVDELREAGIKLGEESALEAKHKKLANAAEWSRATGIAIGALDENDESAVGYLNVALKALSPVGRQNDDVDQVREQLSNCRDLVAELSREVALFQQSIEFDDEQLALSDQRLSLLQRLKIKHGTDEPGLIALCEEKETELFALSELDKNREALVAKREALEIEAGVHAQVLSDKRRRIAERLSQELTTEVRDLGMDGATIHITVRQQLLCNLDEKGAAARLDKESQIHNDKETIGVLLDGQRVKLSPHGIDHIVFEASTNPGEDYHDLSKVASGGERSRILLALRLIFVNYNSPPFLVFDEVDAGVGGATADKIGLSLKKIARKHQVLVVTHTPQVAAYGDLHFRVRKVGRASGDGRVHSVADVLIGAQREDEIARMLAGSTLSKEARLNARTLLEIRSSRLQAASSAGSL